MGKRIRESSSMLTAGALALLLGGCLWPMPGQGPDRNASNLEEDAIGIDTVASLDQVWTATLDGGPAGDPVTSGHGVNVGSDRSGYIHWRVLSSSEPPPADDFKGFVTWTTRSTSSRRTARHRPTARTRRLPTRGKSPSPTTS